MTAEALDVNPLTRWQRLVARILPWFDADREEEKARRADRIVEQVGRVDSIRIAYRDAGNRVDALRPLDRRARPRG